MLRVRIDEQTSIEGFEDVGFGVYTYSPGKPDNYSEVLGSTIFFPIAISNLDYLKNFLKVLDSGIQRVIEETDLALKRDASLVIRELMFSDTIISPGLVSHHSSRSR